MLKGPAVGSGKKKKKKRKTLAREEDPNRASIRLSAPKRSTANKRGGTNQGNLLAHCQKGQSVTKGLLLRGGVLRGSPSPNTGWVTAAALDMGQTVGRHGDNQVGNKNLLLVSRDVHLIKTCLVKCST